MTDYAPDEIESFLNEYIDTAREEIHSRYSEEDYVPELHDFRKPLQIEVFWMDSPIEFQLLVKTRDSNRKDKVINVNGPEPGSGFFDMVDEVLRKPRWQQAVQSQPAYLRPDHPTSIEKRRQLLIPAFRRLVDTIQRHIFEEPASNRLGGELVGDDIWVFFIHSNVVESGGVTFTLMGRGLLVSPQL